MCKIFFSKCQNQFNIFLEHRTHVRVLKANFGELCTRNCYETQILHVNPWFKRESAWEYESGHAQMTVLVLYKNKMLLINLRINVAKNWKQEGPNKSLPRTVVFGA